MKYKIISICICMLVASTVVSATNINRKEKIQPLSFTVDVPVWEKGDSWTYTFQHTNYKYTSNGTLWGKFNYNCTLIQTVTDDSGDNYTVTWTATDFEGRATFGSVNLKFTPFTKYTGEFIFRKTDLGCYRESHQLKGLVFWLIGTVGFPFPAQYMHTREWIYETAGEYLPFPMTAGTNGTFPGFQYSYQEKCSLYWGIVSLFNIPVTNSSSVPTNYHCEMENITVPKGTYNAYNVSVDLTYGLGQHHTWRYYVPEVGNTVKVYINADHDDSGKPGTIYKSELVDFNYTP